MVAMMGLVAGAQRRALPATAVMAQIAQPWVHAGIDERLDFGRRCVLAGVVDDDQLGEALRGHGRIRLLDEAADVAGLIECWNDNGDAHQVPLSHRTRRDAPSITRKSR
jgi:hypothetical protein